MRTSLPDATGLPVPAGHPARARAGRGLGGHPPELALPVLECQWYAPDTMTPTREQARTDW